MKIDSQIARSTEGDDVRNPSFRIPHSGFCTRKGGSALIVVLWLVGILSLLVSTMAFEAHLEAKISSHARKKLKADSLVVSGVEIAEMLMTKSDGITAGKLEEEEEDDRWYDTAKKLSDGLKVSGLSEEVGEGVVVVDIEPEPARRNVNRLSEEDWERVLEVGGVPIEMWPTIVESFQDWTDKDSEVRRDGAETVDYYATLEKPYKAKNGPVDTVEELLLVKGFSRPVLSGGVVPGDEESPDPVQMSGIVDLLTVYGDGKVNINAASQRVLMTLPGVDEIIAGAIIEEREGLLLDEDAREDTSFKSVNDLFRRIPELDPAVRKDIVTGSQIYRVTSVATVGGVSRKIWCVGIFSEKRLEVLRWWEHE